MVSYFSPAKWEPGREARKRALYSTPLITNWKSMHYSCSPKHQIMDCRKRVNSWSRSGYAIFLVMCWFIGIAHFKSTYINPKQNLNAWRFAKKPTQFSGYVIYLTQTGSFKTYSKYTKTYQAQRPAYGYFRNSFEYLGFQYLSQCVPLLYWGSLLSKIVLPDWMIFKRLRKIWHKRVPTIPGDEHACACTMRVWN